MNKRLLSLGLVVVLGLVAVLAAPSLVRADQGSTGRLITVTGDADVKVVPDEVILVIGVETWDLNVSVAKTQNDDRVKRILALTSDNFAIEPKYVQTDRINVEPRWRSGTYTKDDFIGYFVRKSIAITLKDLTRFDELQTAVLNAGATHIQSIQYRTTELRKHRDQARSLAIKAAQEKATALAGELGQKVGQPQTIEENYSGWSSPYSSWYGGNMAQNVSQNAASDGPQGDGSISLGMITVNARVTVVFNLE